MTEKEFQTKVLKKLASLDTISKDVSDLKKGQERLFDLFEENEKHHEMTQHMINQAFQKITWIFDLPARMDHLEKEVRELRAIVS